MFGYFSGWGGRVIIRPTPGLDWDLAGVFQFQENLAANTSTYTLEAKINPSSTGRSLLVISFTSVDEDINNINIINSGHHKTFKNQ